MFKAGRSELRILDCNRKELSKKTADLKDIEQVSASRLHMPQTSSRWHPKGQCRPPSLIRLIVTVMIGSRVCCRGAAILMFCVNGCVPLLTTYHFCVFVGASSAAPQLSSGQSDRRADTEGGQRVPP